MGRATKIVPVQMADGTTFSMEVTPLGGDEDIALEILSFESVRKSLHTIAEEICEVFAEIQPTKASVEFGLEIGMEAGKLVTLLVKGTATATMKITMEWQSADQSEISKDANEA